MINPDKSLFKGNAIKETRSMGNPSDLAAVQQDMKNMGGLPPDATVADVMNLMGIDVNGPASQLTDFGKKQAENATPDGKMKNLAMMGGPAPGGDQGMMSSGGEPAGLDALLKQ